MKRLVLLTLAAIAALVSTSCSKSYDMTGEPAPAGMQVIADVTRTTNDGLHTLWAANDAINLFYAPAGTTTYSSNYQYTTADAGASATFTGGITDAGTSTLDWYALYPYSSKLATPANEGCYFNIGCANSYSKAQVQEGNDNTAHLAGQHFPLLAKVKDWNPATADNTVALSFKPMLSVVKIVVKNSTTKPLTVSAAEMTADEDIIGSYYINFAGENPTFTPSGPTFVAKTAKLTVSNGTAIEVGSTASFYLAIKPFSASGEKTYKFAVNGYEKSVNLTDAAFSAGMIKTVNFNFDQEEKDFSGTYVVLAKNGSSYYAMSGEPGASTFMPKVDFEYDGTTTPVKVTTAALVWTVAKTDAGYTFQCKSNDKYLSYSGSGNSAAVLATLGETCYMNVLEQTNKTFSIMNKAATGRRLCYNITNPRFAFYSGVTGTGDMILVEATFDAAPVLNPITAPSKVDASGATGVSVTYSVTNPVQGRLATASTTETWIRNFDCSTYGTISFDVDANTGAAERSGDVTVSYEGAQDVTFTVTQNFTGGTTTYTWTLASGQLKTAGGDYTANGIKWTYPSITYVGYDTTKGAQIGSGNNVQNSFTISTSDFGTATIKSVKVNASMGSKGDAKVSISVGGTTVLSNQALTTSATEYSATGINKSGAVEISFSATAKAYYLKSIVVEY